MAVSRRLRYEILRRDGHTCRYCGASAPDVPLRIDHVIPVALGGGDEPSNLVTACQDCNSGKSSTSPDAELVEDVDVVAMLFSAAMDKALTSYKNSHQDEQAVLAEFDELWLRWTYNGGMHVPRPGNWRQSILKFVQSGFALEFQAPLIEVAMTNRSVQPDDIWRYFCGCCWNRIGDIREHALRLIEDGEVS